MKTKVTAFKDIRQTKNPSHIELEYVLNSIRDGKIKGLVESIRNEPNRTNQQELKKTLPCILFSGIFSERSDNALVEHSGIICLDFDKFSNSDDLMFYRDYLISDKYTYSVFISPSGDGLKVLVKIPADKENHRAYFLGLKDYYNSPNFDISCVNESRVCYLSSDETIFINEDSEVFKTKVEKKEYQQKNTEVQIEVLDSEKVIAGLYKWWNEKYGIVDGERNRNTFILSMALNEFGVPEIEAKNFCSQFSHEGFDSNEINGIVERSYAKTHLFGTKKFSKIEKYQEEIESQVNKDSKTVVNFHNIYQSAFIDVTKRIEYPPVALSIGSHQLGNKTFPITFGTYGNFSCLVGASKSRKTFFKSMLLASYIGGKSSNLVGDIKTHRDRECFIVDIDSEQGTYDAQRVFKRVMDMVGVENYEFYKPFALRPYEPKERLEFIEWLIYESELKDNIGLISIDGLADLVNDFNDLKESQAVIQKVMRWTDEKQFHLTTVLHSNFGTSKAVGHIGSSVLKKAETVCQISSSDGISTVNFTHTRGYPIADIQYSVNEDGLPYILNSSFTSNSYEELLNKKKEVTEEKEQLPFINPSDAFEKPSIDDVIPF
jgi:hypothetical protein